MSVRCQGGLKYDLHPEQRRMRFNASLKAVSPLPPSTYCISNIAIFSLDLLFSLSLRRHEFLLRPLPFAPEADLPNHGIMFKSTCPDAVEMADTARTYSAAVQRLRRASRRLIGAGASRRSCFLYKPPLRCGCLCYKYNCTPWGLYAARRQRLSCTSFTHGLSPTNTPPGRRLRRGSLSMAESET
jgi:hypothetical protein